MVQTCGAETTKEDIADLVLELNPFEGTGGDADSADNDCEHEMAGADMAECELFDPEAPTLKGCDGTLESKLSTAAKILASEVMHALLALEADATGVLAELGSQATEMYEEGLASIETAPALAVETLSMFRVAHFLADATLLKGNFEAVSRMGDDLRNDRSSRPSLARRNGDRSLLRDLAVCAFEHQVCEGVSSEGGDTHFGGVGERMFARHPRALQEDWELELRQRLLLRPRRHEDICKQALGIWQSVVLFGEAAMKLDEVIMFKGQSDRPKAINRICSGTTAQSAAKGDIGEHLDNLNFHLSTEAAAVFTVNKDMADDLSNIFQKALRFLADSFPANGAVAKCFVWVGRIMGKPATMHTELLALEALVRHGLDTRISF